MKRTLRSFAPVASSLFTLLFIGATAPSCPGNQAVQQQLEQVQNQNQGLIREVQTLEAQVKEMRTEMTQLRTLATQIGNTVLAQKQALEQVGSVRATQAAPVREKADPVPPQVTASKPSKPAQKKKPSTARKAARKQR